MDRSAVLQASDNLLEQLGITRHGDRLALKGFCKEKKDEQATDRKRSLLESFLMRKGSSKRPSSKESASCSKPPKAKKDKERRLSLGWLHFSAKKNAYKAVRLVNGGGNRDVSLLGTSTKDDIIHQCTKLFFPDGSNRFAGPVNKLVLGLANFGSEEIKDSKGEIPFNLDNYIAAHKLTKVRLYLTTREKPDSSGSENEDTDDGDLRSYFIPSITLRDENDNTGTYINNEEQLSSTDRCDFERAMENVGMNLPRENTLLGSSEQRKILLQQQDSEFEESLRIDIAKQDVLDKEIRNVERKEETRAARQMRVPEEPNVNSNHHVRVQVRHLTHGLLHRRFARTELVQAVYDWVGSFSADPEHYELHLPCATLAVPSQPISIIDRYTLVMLETSCTPSAFEDDPEVEFKGFGSTHHNSAASTDTLIDLSVDTEVEEQLPINFMEAEQQLPDNVMEDDHLSSDTANESLMDEHAVVDAVTRNDPGYQFRQHTLPALLARQGSTSTAEAGNETGVPRRREIKIHRHHVRNDMITIFSDPMIVNDHISVVMINQKGETEAGEGTGVTRDAFSMFWIDVYQSLMQGEDERVPFIRHDFQRNEWESISRILVVGYVSCRYFPMLLSKTFMAHCLFGESIVSEDMLLESFRNYVSPSERMVLDQCLKGDIDPTDDEVMELLQAFECRILPTRDNITRVIAELAQKELIQRPQYVANCWKAACETLRTYIDSPAALDELYDQLKPTTSKVLARIRAYPENDAERECMKYFRRYIKGLQPSNLTTFLRFCTGAELILFDELKVTFTQLEKCGRRPIAHTCTFTLELPSTYQSFPELREEFNNILQANVWEMDIV